ncbi:hypothetical protein MKX01_041652, partial [Papaver californicum]
PKDAVEPKVKGEPKLESSNPEAEEISEQDELPKPEAKSPRDLLPPCRMLLDEGKRLYSNTTTNFCEVAIK